MAEAPSTHVRTFVAIHPSDAQRAAIERVVERLDGAVGDADVRWVPPSQVHVTLAFLGDVERERLGAVAEALEPVAAEHAPFELVLRDVDAFPDRAAPRVVWLGIARGRAPLVHLADAIRGALAPLGLAEEGAPHRPHLTLGRVARGASEGARGRVARAIADFGAGSGTDGATVDAFTLVTSRPHGHGAAHDVAAHLPLQGRS